MGELQLPFSLQPSSLYQHIPTSLTSSMDPPLLSPAPTPRRKLTLLGIPIFTFKRNKPPKPDRPKKAPAKNTRWPFFSSTGSRKSNEVSRSASLRNSEEKNRIGGDPPVKVEYYNANEKLSGNSYPRVGSWNQFGLPSSPLRTTLEVILEDVSSNTKDSVEEIKLELFTPSPSHGDSPPPTLNGIFNDIAHDVKEKRDEEVKWITFIPSPNHGGSPLLPTLSRIPDDIACHAKGRSGEENKLDLFGPFPSHSGWLPSTLSDIARNAFSPFPSHDGSPPSNHSDIVRNAEEERDEDGEEKIKWDSFSPSPSHGGSLPPPTLSDILDEIACNAKERDPKEAKLDLFSRSPSHGGSTPPTMSDIARNAKETRGEKSEERTKLDSFSPSKSHGGSPPPTLGIILDKNNSNCDEEIKLDSFSPSPSHSGSPPALPTTTCDVKEDEINWNPIGPSEPSKVPSEMVAQRTGGVVRRDPPHLQMMLILRKIVIMQKVVRAISYSQGLFLRLLSDAKRSMAFSALSELRVKGKRDQQLCNKRILMGKRCRPLDIEEGHFDGGSGPVAGAENVPKSPGKWGH